MAIDGLTAFLYELRNLPVELKAEAGGIVLDTAEAAAEEIRANYPEESKTIYSTGTLKRGVRVKAIDAGQFGAAARVASTAPHAYLYENGSDGMRKTSKGYERGKMPAAHVFIPIAIRHRKGMYAKLAELLERRGVTVDLNGV